MSELKHYGVLGMKWGVRKDRTRPSFGERRKVRKLKGEYVSAKKNVRNRESLAKNDRELVKYAEKNYQKKVSAANKFTLNQAKRNERYNSMIVAEQQLERKRDWAETSEVNRRRAREILAVRTGNLIKYVDSLNKTYGEDNVKQLKTKEKLTQNGKDYMEETYFKTGVRVQNLPVIGRAVSSRQIAKWEKEYQDELRERDIEKRLK